MLGIELINQEGIEVFTIRGEGSQPAKQHPKRDGLKVDSGLLVERFNSDTKDC